MTFDQQYLRYVVEHLASLGSHQLGFRVAGTPEERAATSFIASELRDAVKQLGEGGTRSPSAFLKRMRLRRLT